MIYKLNIRKVRLIRSCQSLVNGDTIYSGEYCQVFLSLCRLYIYIKYCHWTIHSLVSLLTEYIPLNLGTQDTTHTARSDSLLDISHTKLIELFETSIFLMWTFNFISSHITAHLHMKYVSPIWYTCIFKRYRFLLQFVK